MAVAKDVNAMATDGDERDGTAKELNRTKVVSKAEETRGNTSLWQ